MYAYRLCPSLCLFNSYTVVSASLLRFDLACSRLNKRQEIQLKKANLVIFVEIKNVKHRLRGEADLSLYSTYAKCAAKMRGKEEKEFEEKEFEDSR